MSERMVLELPAEEARYVVYGDHEDWDEVSGTKKIHDASRWSIHKSGVFKNNKLDKCFEFSWSVGATEMQEESPYQYDTTVKVFEVRQVEKLIKVWDW